MVCTDRCRYTHESCTVLAKKLGWKMHIFPYGRNYSHCQPLIYTIYSSNLDHNFFRSTGYIYLVFSSKLRFSLCDPARQSHDFKLRESVLSHKKEGGCRLVLLIDKINVFLTCLYIEAFNSYEGDQFS